MDNLGRFKFKRSLIFSLLLSLALIVSAFCANLLPNMQQSVLASDVSTSDVTTDLPSEDVVTNGKWEDIETMPMAVSGDSYEISNTSTLIDFVKKVNNGNTYYGYTVYLTADINLSGKIWTPIGDSSHSFRGLFDGRGHKITGLTIDTTIKNSYVGLFGYIGSSAIIRNLFVEGVYINTNNSQYVGGLVACSTGTSSYPAQIINCGVSGYIQSQYSDSGYVGGVAGYCSYTGVTKSFSTVAIDTPTSNGPYAGGLIGYLTNVNTGTRSVSQCFYYSIHGVTGTTGRIGFIGYSSYILSSYIKDVYSSSGRLFGNSSSYTSPRKTNPANWTTTTNTYGEYMHNQPMQVLKGVGNIYVEIDVKVASYNTKTMAVSESTTTYTYFYSILTQKGYLGGSSVSDPLSSNTVEISSGSNNNFPYVKLTRNMANDDDVITTIGSSTSLVTDFSKATSDLTQATYNLSGKISDSAFSLGDAKFSLNFEYDPRRGYNDDVAFLRSGTKSKDYTLNLSSVCGYYEVELHSRGKLVEHTFNFNEYSNVGATAFKNPDNIYHTTQPAKTYSILYNNSNLFSNIEEKAGWGKNNQSEISVYIPYSEAYKISLTGTKIDGVSYLDMISDWGSVAADSSGVLRISKSVNLKDSSGKMVGNALPEEGQGYYSTDTFKFSQTINYYFNNLQPVTLKLYDEKSLDQGNFHTLSGTYPVFVDSVYSSEISNKPSNSDSSTPIIATLDINVMAGEDISKTGFSIGDVYRGGSGSVYTFGKDGSSISFKSLASSGYFAPYWPEFCLTGFSFNDKQIIQSISDNDTIEPTLKMNAATWAYKYSETKPATFLATWGECSYIGPELSFSVDDITVQKGQYENIVREMSTSWDDTSNITSTQSGEIAFVIKQGYELSDTAMSLTLANGKQDIGNILIDPKDGLNLNGKDNNITFLYGGNNVNLTNVITINWKQSTGEVVIRFKHLMGIENITVKLKSRVFNVMYTVKISGDDSGVSRDIMKLSIDGASSKSTLSTNSSDPPTSEFVFGSYSIKLTDIDILPGYTYNDIKIYVNSAPNIPQENLFNINEDDIEKGIIVLDQKTWDNSVFNFETITVEFVVTRNRGTLQVNFEGLDSSLLTGDILTRRIESSSNNNSIEASENSNTMSTTVNTDDSVKLIVYMLAEFALIQKVSISMPGNTYVTVDKPEMVGDNLGLKNLELGLNNFVIENSGDKIVVNVTFEPIKANVTVLERTTKNGGQISQKVLQENKPVSYGFQISKQTNSSVLNFVDYNISSNDFSVNINNDPSVAKILIYIGDEDGKDITISNAFNITPSFKNGEKIQVVIEYQMLTSQVQVLNALVKNGSTTISNTNAISSNEYISNEIVSLSASAQAGYEFKGWYLFSSDSSITINGTAFGSGNLVSTSQNDDIRLLATAGGDGVLIKNFMYFVAVYEAKVYTLEFDTSKFLDSVNNQSYDVSLSNQSALKIEYNTNTIIGDLSPTAIIQGNEMYEFVQWENEETGITLKGDSDTVIANWKAPSGNTIILTPVFKAKTVTLYYCDANGNRDSGLGALNVVYGEVPTSVKMPTQNPVGYTFGGWKYNNTIYYPYSNGQWGTFVKWTSMVLEANITPQWNAITVDVTFSAGPGEFSNGASEVKANVLFGTNNYVMLSPLTTPTWTVEGATYEFAGYYKATKNNQTYYYYPSNISQSDICYFTSEDNVVFYACYELVSVDVSLIVNGQSTGAWVYNGQSYSLEVVIPSGLPFAQNGTKTIFKKDGQETANTSIKDVAQSGTYTCEVTLYGTEGEYNSKVALTTGSVTQTATITVTVSPKMLTVAQNGTPTNVVTKVFDNTLGVPNVTFSGAVAGDNVTVSIQYIDKNVGTNKDMSVTISGQDRENYYVEDIKGEITPFVITYTVSGTSYKVGPDDEKISIASDNITLDSDSKVFLSKIGASPVITLQTSRNVVGVYTYNGSQNKIEVVSFVINGSGVDQNNFTYSILGQYEIADAGAEEVVMQIRVLCDDLNAPNISSLATLTVNGTYTQVSGNGTQNVYIVDTRTNFEQNSRLSLTLNRDVNYWIDRVLVNNAETTVNINSSSSADEITYTLTGAISGSITIDIYITTLSNITLNYDLADGESLSGNLPTSTTFAYQKTISQSIATYGAVLPTADDVVRTGFVFTGWRLESNNVLITESTTWSYKYDAVLVAQYEIAKMEVEYYVDDVLDEIIDGVSTFESVYDATTHKLEFRVLNTNNNAISYTYSWTRNSAQYANQSSSLSVTNVKDSGYYTVTIRATATQNQLYTTSQTIALNVNIAKQNLFTNNYIITKQYDGTITTPSISIMASGQAVTVVGVYVSKDSGSGLDTTISKWTINGTRADSSSLNFALNFDSVNLSSSVITPKNVTLSIGNQSQEYTGELFTVKGSYTIQTPFDYIVSTTLADVGTYTQSNDGLTVNIIGDKLSNFNLTISGSLQITVAQINVTWTGTSNLTFDANFHSLTPSLPDFVEILSINYVASNEIKYSYSSIAENKGAYDAGTYTVSVVCVDTENYEIANDGTLTINKRTIYVDYDGVFNTKTYDGTTAVVFEGGNENVAKIYNNSSLTQLLSEVITDESALPKLVYTYASQIAGDNKEIIVSLEDDTNYTISSSHDSLVGKINKLSTTLYIKAQKVYDAQSDFVVSAEGDAITATVLADGESVSGSVTFIGIKNAGTYYNLKTLQKTIALRIGAFDYSVNYDVTFIDSDQSQQSQNYLRIDKAQVTVSTNKNNEYIYSGQEVAIEYSFANTQNRSVVPNKQNVVFEYVAISGSLDNEKAVQVGNYTFNMSLSGDDATNFDISGDIQSVAFSIVQREILIQFSQDIVFEYQNSVVTYLKDEGQQANENEQLGNDRSILASGYTIGIGDVLSWSFTTKLADVGTYYINNPEKIEKILSVTKDGQDYTNNYEFSYHIESCIIISPQKINFADIKLVNSSSEYDGFVKDIKIEFYDKYYTQNNGIVTFKYGDSDVEFTDFIVLRYDSTSSNVQSPSDILYAGEYKFGLTLSNYTIVNGGQLTYTITRSKLDLDIGQLSKVYDGTTLFTNVSLYPAIEKGGEQGEKRAPYAGDSIEVIGTYAQKDVGQNIAINFTLTSTEPNVLSSYYIDVQQNYTGSITQKEVALKLKDVYTNYYIGSEISIDVSNFDIVSPDGSNGLVNQESMVGDVGLPIVNVDDAYDISQIELSNIEFNLIVMTYTGAASPLSNYLITGVSGTVAIRPAHVIVAVNETSKIYDGTAKNATITYSSRENYGAIIDSEVNSSITVTYRNESGEIVTPIDAGVYDIIITVVDGSNYVVVDDFGEPRQTFVSKYPLVINRREVSVDVTYTYAYDGQVATYQIQPNDVVDPTTTKTGGLVNGHSLSGLLKTNSHEANRYSVSGYEYTELDQTSAIYTENLNILIVSTGSDVTANYKITINADILIVADVQNINSDAIKSIEYCAKDVTGLDVFKISFTFGGQTYEIEYAESVTFGNGYTATLGGLSIYGTDGVQTAQEAKDVGQYRLTLAITNEDSALSVEDKYIDFSIYQRVITQIEGDFDKYYDKTSKVINDLSSPQIFASDEDSVTIVGYYTENSQPTIFVGTHAITFTLEGERANNYRIALESTIFGEISKQPIILSLLNPVTVYYSGQASDIQISMFKALKGDDLTVSVDGIINNLSGSIVSVIEVNAGDYDLSSLFAQNSLRTTFVDTTSVLNNYEVVGFEGDFTIKPCEVVITIDNTSTIYNAQSQSVSFTLSAVSGHGSIVESDRQSLITILYDGDSKLPINAGRYEVTAQLSEGFEQNYTISNGGQLGSQFEYGTFTIEKREIAINIGTDEELIYTGEKVAYTLTNDDVTQTATTPSGLVAGHTVKGYYLTSDSEIFDEQGIGIVYEIGGDTYYLTLTGFDILQNGVSVLDNYDLVSQQGSLHIIAVVAGTIDDSYLQNLVYTATDYASNDGLWISAEVSGRLMTFVYGEDNVFGSLSNLTNGDGQAVSEARNAGTYRLYLTIENSDTQNKMIEFSIAPRQITLLDYTHDKNYDGTSSIIGDITSSQVYDVDKSQVEILGYYVDADQTRTSKKGEHYVEFVFSGSGAMESNYTLPNYLDNTGSILARDIYLALTQGSYQVYYTNEIVQVGSDLFSAYLDDTDEVIADFATNVTGNVAISLFESAQYDLNKYFAQIDVTGLQSKGDYLENYNIVAVSGTLDIQKAEVLVAVSDYEKVYNGEVQTPTFTLSIYSGHGKLAHENIQYVQYLLTGSQNYTTSPVNAGTYAISISIQSAYSSNYTLNFDNQNVETYTAKESLVILKKDITITSKPSAYTYTGAQVVYDILSSDVDGLVNGQALTGTLTTNGYRGGVYTLNGVYVQGGDYTTEQITPNITISSIASTTTSNYNITIDAQIIIISSLTNFDTSKLSGLVYNGEDKVAKEEIVVSLTVDDEVIDFVYGKTYTDATFASLKYTGEGKDYIDDTAIYAGEYSFIVNFDINGSTMEQEVTFTISPKTISQISLQNDKTYDATANVLGEITSTDILEDDIVLISGTYANENAGTHEITLQLSGEDAYNYILNSNLGLSGTINARPITLSVTNNVTYTGKNAIVLADNITVGGDGLVQGQTLSGFITILKTNAGSYDFNIQNIDISNFKILDVDADVTLNYSVTYLDKVVIDKMNLTLVVEDIDLTYNARIQSIDSFLSFEQDLTGEGLSENIAEEARLAIGIEYDQTPLNAGDYHATISSNSNNFVITYQEDNVVDFTIKKRDLQINIGEIVYDFNPTSNYETQFDASYLTGLVEGQVVSGTFGLSEAGLDVGVYTFVDTPGVTILSELSIIVNDINIIDLNYNLSAEKLGSIEIVPFELNASQVWLSESQIQYRGVDISSYVTVYFVNANGVVMTITSQDKTYGYFEIIGDTGEAGDAINVGSYTVNVTISNYNLENSELMLEITHAIISNVTFENNKTYDGNASVYDEYGRKNLASPSILAADRGNLNINAYYVDGDDLSSDIGVHTIRFEFSEPDKYPALNYKFELDESGEIMPREAQVEITHDFAYSETGNYVLTYIDNSSDFNVTGILETNSLSGQISINGLVSFVGQVDISKVDTKALLIVDENQNDVTSNYIVTFVSNIEIVKAQISISFDEIATQFTYSNTQVEINPIITFVNSQDTISNDYLTRTFVGDKYTDQNAPKDVGTYTVTYEVRQDLSNYYEIVSTNAFTFEILPYEIELQVGDIPNDIFFKQYGQADPELRYSILSDLGETISITFTREQGEEIGTYDLMILEIDNTNYVVTAVAGALSDLFRITRAGTLNIVILNTPENVAILQKVYDNKNIDAVDISSLSYEANGEVVTGTIMFQEGVNVGSYPLGTSHNLQNANYETFAVTSEVMYQITPKPITLVVNGGDKDYDASNAFFGTIEIHDDEGNILDNSVFKLTASATFATSNVGENIALNVTYSQDNISNYEVKNSSVSANITKRNVTITPDLDQVIVYGTQGYVITYQIEDLGTTTFTGIFENEISGELYVESYDAGSWPILSNLSSGNLQITFTKDVIFTITPKQLTVTSSDEFRKVYDGTADVLGELTVTGIIEGDQVEVSAHYDSADVGDNKTVSFELSGLDKDNYFVEDVKGVILELGVTLNYVYIVDGFEMINQNLIQNTSKQSDNLIYGVAISTSVGSLPVPSHEGYDFDGWYLDEDFTTLVTDDTVINESIWPIDETEMTAYAKWTIKQFNLSIVVATRVNGTYVVDAEDAGGTHQNINGLYDYGTAVSLQGLATANPGYTFVGYANDLLLDADDSIAQNGIVVGANDVTLYAKFAPQSVLITLDANGGVFETDASGWELNSTNTIATRTVEFNSTLGVSLPKATKIGYTQDITLWEDENKDLIQINADTLMDENFYPEKMLYAHYEAADFEMTLDANGGYFENVDEFVWTIVERDENGNATVVSRKVLFDSPVGEILIPVRAGYEFSSWSIENFDENYIWQSVNMPPITANWNEMQFDIQITSLHGTVEYKVVNSSLQIIESGSVDKTTKIIQVMTTYKLTLSVKADAGYTFNSWASDNSEFDGETSLSVSTNNEFIQDYTIEAQFDANENTITIVVNDTNRGYVTANTSSTTADISSFDVVIKTGETLDISAYANEGYTLSDWVVTGIGDVKYSLSGLPTDSDRTLGDFVSDLTVTVNFTPSPNEITISADAQKGTIHYMLNGKEIEISGSYTATNIFTESTFEFDIVALHGYKIDMNLQNWAFETTSLNKGVIDVNSSDDGYTAHVTLTGFTSSGEIVVPFVNDVFEVQIQVIRKDGSQLTRYDANDIVSLESKGMTSLLSTGDSFSGEYLSQVTLSPQEIIDGYNFYMWSVSDTRVESVSASTGFVGFTESGDLIYSIVDDMTLYLVYEIESFNVTYVVNDTTMGGFASEGSNNISTNRTVSVSYGYDAPTITAVSGEYFAFEKWVRVKLVDGEYVEYLVDGMPVEYFEQSITIKNVTEDCTYMAVFTGIEISFTVSLVLPDEDVFSEEEINFASLEVVDENSLTTITGSERVGNTITYTIDTFTGSDIGLVINLGEGYEYEGILAMDPRVLYSIIYGENSLTFSLENLYLETAIELSIRAKVYDIRFNIVGQEDGAEIYSLTNVEGVVGSRYENGRKTLVISAKHGSDVQSILYILTGYKLVDNPYFELSSEQGTLNSVFSETYIGTLSSVSGELSIDVKIEAKVYEVTLDLGYDEVPNRTTTSVISHGQTTFNPELSTDFTAPVRYGYRFLGYTTVDLTNPDGQVGTTYYFDGGGIYSILPQSGGSKVYGFRGAENTVASTKEGIDYEVKLYAIWEIIRYEVKLVFVPSTALNQNNLNYNEIFPLQTGRANILNSKNEIVGVEYVPGSEVIVNAPAKVFTGYSYYGWSYVDGITSKTDENLLTGQISFEMAEEDIVIYIYYAMTINISSTQGGTATASAKVALYGEIITISATNDYGYIFSHWLQNSSEIENSTLSMQITTTAPSTFVAVFVGEKINVNINQVDNATLSITNTTGDENDYRVGDTLTLTISDITYGYEHRGWVGGGYSGMIRSVSGDANSFNYTIVPDDFARGYVTFELTMGAKSVSVRFSVVGEGECGDILVNNSSVTQQTQSYVYDNTLKFVVDVYARYELVSLTLNGKDITLNSDNSIELLINNSVGFTCDGDGVNQIVATFRKMLWTDNTVLFTGLGTKDNPYLIQSAEQLAKIAELINGKVAVEVGSTPYEKAYYLVTTNIDLSEKFWVPIGTVDNPFNGTFDLNGYTITDLEADDWTKVNARPKGMPYGLFGYVGPDAKFITGDFSYTITLVIIFSVIGGLLLIILLIILILMSRRRKMRKLSASSTLGNDIMSQEELLKAQKIQSKRNNSKKK